MITDSNRLRRVAAVGVVAAALGIMADRAFTQAPAKAPAAPPPDEPTLVSPATPDYGTRPVAYIHDTVPVTRAELAEFLIARGGYEKVELIVNKKIIDMEAAKRGITISPQELEAGLNDDLKGIEVKKADFISVVLPKYGKSLYEWMEDVVRPRLLLTKMCRDKVVVTPEDLKLEFERQYGEKRDVQVIIWPESDNQKEVFRIWDKIRNDSAEFDRVARAQANPGLAAAAGKTRPINHHLVADDAVVETKAFSLKEGEVSEVFRTKQGYMVIKVLKHIPADATMTLEKATEKLKKDMFEVKLTQMIPLYFADLKKAAKPLTLLNGPPTQWRTDTTKRTE